MTKVDIDLRQEPKEETEELAVTPGEKEADETVESEFPHFHFESPDVLDIPSSGKMVVEYEVVFDNEDEGGEGDYVYKVDLKRIVGVEAAPNTPKKNETEDALDKLASERAAVTAPAAAPMGP